MSIINSMLTSLTTDKQRGALLRRISASKDSFIRQDISPFGKLFVEPEVAESWIISKRSGVNPYVLENMSFATNDELTSRRKENEQLLSIVEKTFDEHHNIIEKMTSVVFFADSDGVVLLLAEGEITNEAFKQSGTKVGGIWKEEITGTSAIALCVKHRTLIQLVGPEHYQVSMQDHLTTAAPIFAEDGAFLGVIATTTLHNKVGTGLSHMQPYMLGWTLSLASSIENENKLQRHLTQDQSEYHSYLAKMIEGEGYAIISTDGIVTDVVNSQTESIISSWSPGKHISSYLDNCTTIEKALSQCKSLDEFPLHYSDNVILVSLEAFESRSCCVMSIRLLEPKQGSQTHCKKIAGPASDREYRRTIDDIVGISPQLAKIKRLATRAAESSVNTLITGEQGSGKQLFARAIAASGAHSADRMVTVSCSAIPESSIEVELFGCNYEGTAHTRAFKAGLLEQARDGILLISEIADIPRKVQAALLAAIESRSLLRVCGTEKVPLGTLQIIATTEHEPTELIREGRVREDLLTALSVITIRIPPLRERRDDIRPLIDYYLKEESLHLKKEMPRISKRAIEVLAEHPLPGNVRQLINAVQYGILMSANGVIDADALPLSLQEPVMHDKSGGEADGILSLREAEHNAIVRALSYTNMNLREAARILGIGRSTLYRKLEEFGIRYR